MLYFFKKKNNNFWIFWLLTFVILELLSWLSFSFNQLNLVILLLVGFITLFLSLRKPIFMLYIPLAEIFWGSLGHSFYYNFLNTRLVIFVIIFLIFVLQTIFQRQRLKMQSDKNLLFIWFSILLFILAGVGLAFYNQHKITDIFLDANAYLYILYLPIWYEFYNEKYLPNILGILKAAVLVIAAKTLIIFNIFAQDYSWLNIEAIYKWIRDSRTGEITFFQDNFWRVFMQSQIYLVVAWFFAFVKQIKEYKNWPNFIYLAIITAALLLSLSRSFWLGTIVGLLFLFINIIIYQKKYIFFASIILFLGTILSSFIIVQIFFNIPKWNSVTYFLQRQIDINEPAADSRMQLLIPLWSAIEEKPILGYGFAKEITYYSSDPRIKNETNPQGLHRTYAFEWGWFDQWLKLGVIFISLLLLWIVLIYHRSYKVIVKNQEYVMASLAVLTSLMVIHIFSPFLNHPLGLGILIFITIIISNILYGQKPHGYH